MSEENNVIYCGQCGSRNPDNFKFCSNCGAKLEKAKADTTECGKDDPVFSAEQAAPVYEKVEAEIVNEEKKPVQDEIQINYGADEGTYSSGGYESSQSRYYSSNNASEVNYASSNGNIGFAIASMVCGILSLICCCFSLFSLVLGVAAVVLGIVCLSGKYEGKGMAIAGIITGGIGIFIWVIFILIGGSGMLMELMNEIAYY
ncbi:MAG: DUF4190 domain-containing protein [Lachnospiraceae bacterium]|nr:DUF4190 domain-containing protein [Lachnospiraceae bacterium]